MLFELTMVPLGLGDHIAAPLADVLRIVDASGVRYRLTPSGTCLEGEWDEVMPVVRACHDALRKGASHVITTIGIEDQAGASDMLRSNVVELERRIGHPLEKLEAPAAASPGASSPAD